MLLDVDVKGSCTIMEEFDENVISIFIEPPGEDLNEQIGSESILERRTAEESEESANDSLSLFDAPKGTRQFEAKVSDLDSNSTYYYSVFDGEQRLTPKDPSYHFKTHPKPGTNSPVYFWVVGDSGTGGENQARVHTAMRKYNQIKN